MGKRPLHLDDYGISKELYNELRWFCRQYPDKVAQLSAIRGGFNNLQLNDSPKGTGVSNPTEARAMRALQLRDDIKAIEQSAIEADAGLYQQIINNVVHGICYEDMPVPSGINQFYKARRRFFWHLAHRMGKIGD